MHVLEIESTRYAEHIAKGGDGILAGCVCSRCSGTEIILTKRWVERGFNAGGKYQKLAVVFARCVTCKARERVVPSDVLPGKVNSVGTIFEAISMVRGGSTITAASKTAQVSRQCVSYWIRGVASRYLDLARLWRHRAQVAQADLPGQSTLIMFWAFVAQARLEYPALRWPAEPSSSPIEVIREAIVASCSMVALVEDAGGAPAVAELGATLFRQAVLLFRSGGVDTPICGDSRQNFEHGDLTRENRFHANQKSKAQRCCLLASRTDRGGSGTRAHCKGERQDTSSCQPDPGSMAVGKNQTHSFANSLSVDRELPQRRARCPKTQAPIRSGHYTRRFASQGYSRGPPSADRRPGHLVHFSLGCTKAALSRGPHPALYLEAALERPSRIPAHQTAQAIPQTTHTICRQSSAPNLADR